MALQFSLRLLSFVLLLFMHGPGGSARDMKALQELAEQKLDNQPYITAYVGPPASKGDDSTPQYKAAYTSKEDTNPAEDGSYASQYKAAYTSKEHNHPVEDGPYTSQYKAAYTSKNHNFPSKDESYTSQYKAAYTSKEHNHPSEDGSYTSQYKAAYRPREHVHPMHRQDSDVRDSSQNYLLGYHNDKRDNSYASRYKAAYNPKSSTQNYLIGYLNKRNDQKDDSYPGYNAAYTPRKHIHQQDQKEVENPYITGYGNSKSKSEKDSENSQKDSKKNQPNYITVYGNSEENTQKDTSDRDPNYITVYGGKKESYLNSYHTTKKVSEDSYAATYQKKGGKSSKVDHTEAFKTGFFALDDIYVGNTMTLQFPVQDFAHFLSRKEVDSIPFSTSQLPSVLQLFSVPEISHEGKAMRDTLEQCELETITGETKVCVTSLESMIEYVQSILGTEDKYNILTTSYPSESSASLQKYTIVKVSEDIYAPKWVACHPMPYPFAVFFCHFINTGSKVFKVSLAGENGDKIEALGLCHMDTSDWSPDHILFQQLGFKPGDAPVCHFFPVKHLLWVPLPSKATM